MKHLKHLLTALLLLCSSVICAHDFEVDGIYYNILSDTDKTVEVTYKGTFRTSYEEEYSGSLVIPSLVTFDGVNYTVTAIGGSAFYDCVNLLNIEVPNSVTSVGKDAFHNTQWYNEQADGVIYVGKVLYKYKGNMPDGTKITIKNGTVCINATAFDGYASLTSITIPNSVLDIGCYAFKDCAGLTTITIPSSVVSLGGCAFSRCTALKELIIEDSEEPLCCQMSEMEYYYYPAKDYDYFFEDSPIEYMYIGRDLENYTFSYSFGQWRKTLNTVVFGDSVTYIPNSIFDSCYELSSVTMSNNVKNIGSYAFYNCDELTNITLPNELTSIGRAAFYSSGLVGVTIPTSVANIEINAFAYCSGLTSIEIPNNVSSIGEHAFNKCVNLADVKFKSNPFIGTDAIPSTATCHLVLDDSDVSDFDITNANKYADVSYSRNISEGKYGTIMLPFAPDAASLENYAFYELTESGDDYMKFEEVLTPIANTPYIYTLRESKENIAITGGETTISSSIVTPEVDGWQTIGSFNNQTIDTSNGNYYVLSANDNEINRITKNLTVLPYRAYFKSVDASKSALNIYISGTTGVEEILSSEIDGFENGAIFDLCGRKVVEPTNGNIYIKNGKKIMF